MVTKRDLFDARTKAYREHRAKLEAAREKRAAKKESNFVKKITSEMAYGASGGNGQNTGETYLAADVRKMPDGGYGVYADKFVKGKRVMTPGGKHRKELKKVYKNKKDANDYMAAIMIAKGGG